MLEEKANDGEIKPASAPARRSAQVIDLMAALKKSLAKRRAEGQPKRSGARGAGQKTGAP
jgi:non-homologous end joining protein Ku